MFHHYFKIASRNFKKNKVFVFINLVSLTFALSCSIIAYLNYNYRDQFNKVHTHTSNIYRVNTVRVSENNEEPWGITPVMLSQSLINDVDTSNVIVRLADEGGIMKANEKVFHEQIHYADSDFLNSFNFVLKEGSLLSFHDGTNILLSEPVAQKYFGKDSPIGKTVDLIQQGKVRTYLVSAVLKAMPQNSSFTIDIVLPFSDFVANHESNWNASTHITTFIKIPTGEMKSQITAQLQRYVDVYNESQITLKVKEFYLQPFNELAYTSDIDMSGYVHGSPLNSNPQGVIVIGPILFSILILLVSAFNFTNTSVVFISNRLKEIGVRKVFGTPQAALIKQFMTENIILCFIALFISLIGSYLLLPFFNQSMNINLTLSFAENMLLIPFLLIVVVITAFLAGFYPAFCVSAYKPIQILKGKATFTSGVFNKILLVIQFSICALTLVTGICMMQNASYQETSDMGYAMETVQVTMIENENEFNLITNAIRSNPKLNHIAGAAHQLGANDSYALTASFEKNEFKTRVLEVGSNYLPTMGLTFLHGRDFEPERASDFSDGVIVNQTFVSQFQITDPLHKTVFLEKKPYTILGIVNDYKEFGNHGKIPPVAFKAIKPKDYSYLVVQSNKKDVSSVAHYLQQEWKKILHDKPYSGFAQVDMMEKEIRLSKGFSSVSFFMAILTILLSAAGLYSLVSLNILRRMKEIAIRKILGAPVFKILALINKDFILLLSISFLLGSSLAYLVVSKVIFNFIYAYHSDITVVPFMIAFFSILAGVMMIVGSRIFKAANTNPAEILKID